MYTEFHPSMKMPENQGGGIVYWPHEGVVCMIIMSVHGDLLALNYTVPSLMTMSASAPFVLSQHEDISASALIQGF